MDGRRGLADPARKLPQTRVALAYARERHAGQKRGCDGAPFIEHPIEVATLLADAGAPDHVIAAGLLHDTIEKTDADAADLRRRFGATIATLVQAVSEDDQIRGYRERKAALRRQVAAAGPEALAIFAADKISKVRELSRPPSPAVRGAGAQPAAPRPRRLAHYRHCLGMLEELLGGSPLVAQLRRELAALPGRSATAA